jgi:hypothetical protein
MTIAVAALLLIAWLFSSSSWREAGLTLIAAAAGLFLFIVVRPWTAKAAS